MKEFTVTMPFAGAITVTVEAENEKQARQKFYEKVEQVTFWNSSEIDRISADVEWDFYEKMGSGNVRHYQFDKMEIQDNGEI